MRVKFVGYDDRDEMTWEYGDLISIGNTTITIQTDDGGEVAIMGELGFDVIPV